MSFDAFMVVAVAVAVSIKSLGEDVLDSDFFFEKMDCLRVNRELSWVRKDSITVVGSIVVFMVSKGEDDPIIVVDPLLTGFTNSTRGETSVEDGVGVLLSLFETMAILSSISCKMNSWVLW